MQTAFVAGATGYTGREVVRLLRARKLRVLAHVRPDSDRLASWQERFGRLGVEVDSTPWEAEAISARLASLQPDLVFALLGTTRARGVREAKAGVSREENSYERVDYGMTMMLLRGLEAAGTGRFVYLSAIGVGPRGNAYMDARWRVEEALRAGSLPWTIARPSFITGPDREESRPAERVGAALTDAATGLLGLFGARSVADRYRSMTATELAGAMVHHALSPTSDTQLLEGAALRGYGPAGG